MDGENNGKPYFLMDDLGENPPIFGSTSKMGPILMPPQSPHLKLLHEGI